MIKLPACCFDSKEKGTGLIRCLLAPQVVSCEHRWWVMLISMARSSAMVVPLLKYQADFCCNCSKCYHNSLRRPCYSSIDQPAFMGHTCIGAQQSWHKSGYLTGINCGCSFTIGRATAFRCEKARRMPSIANDVINDQPPWLTKGRVMPVIGRRRSTPPILTTA